MLDNYGNGGYQNFTRTMPFDKLSGIMTAAEVAEKKASGRIDRDRGRNRIYFAEKPTRPEGEHLTRPEQVESSNESLVDKYVHEA